MAKDDCTVHRDAGEGEDRPASATERSRWGVAGHTLGARLRSVQHGFAGLQILLREPNCRVHAFATLAVAILAVAFRVEPAEGAALALAVGAVWAAEGLNTALERLSDVVSPGWDPRIGVVKDVAAGAVLLAALAAVVAATVVFLPRLL